jgi:hypothetical protein
LTIGEDAGPAGAILEFLDAGFNRVEGFRLGIRAEKSPARWCSFHGSLAYPFSARLGRYALGGVFTLAKSPALSIGGDVYRRSDARPDGGYYSPLYNSLTALLAKNDYRDYYLATGWEVFVSVSPAPYLRGSLAYVAERQESLEKRSDFSLFYPSRLYRENPPAAEGRLRALRLDLRLGPQPVPFDLVTATGIEVSIERSAPSFGPSDFDYLRASAVGTVSFPTAGEGLLLRPGIRVRVAAGASRGTLPPQRLFDVDSRSSGYAPFGVMRSAGVKEFSGTGILSCFVEHNFRSLPFLALGLPFLYEPGIELIVHGGGARTWGAGVPNTTAGWETEAGFGIGRILDLFRADVTWRLNGSKTCVISFGLASLF